MLAKVQRYTCVICKGDSLGGSSIIHGGMFFKLCPICYEKYEDEETVKMINEYWMNIEDETQDCDESANLPVEQLDSNNVP